MFNEPREILDTWMHAVNERTSLQPLLNLYDENAILLPTFSAQTIRDQNARQHYFERLTEREGLTVKLHERTLRIVPAGESISIISGIYSWQFDLEEEKMTFEARFTYVIDLSRQNPILHHHSSQIPRNLS